VLEEVDLEKLGMRTLLAVGQGSESPSKVVVMQWKGGGKEPPLALIGKGVVFDTGGISLKPAGGMEDMTMDMGGAGTVAGAMKAIAGRKAKANVVGIVGLVENMPDGRAQRPGDVVKSMKGDTVEVINTDAEGRLVLCDVMWYAQERFKPAGMIDLATLTGAIIIGSAMKTRAFSPTTTRSATPSSRPRRPRAKARGACRWARPMTRS
jgi:leucyl aminopeptidase